LVVTIAGINGSGKMIIAVLLISTHFRDDNCQGVILPSGFLVNTLKEMGYNY
jgi:hypothetical protein